MRRILPALAVAFQASAWAQQAPIPGPDTYLVGDDPLPQVLLLGTFHFGYPDLDKHVTAKDDRVDVLQSERQREIEELVDVVMRFRPNKLCVETQGGWVVKEYRRYRDEAQPLGRDEMQQIGFRVMDRAALDTAYAVDAGNLVMDLYNGPDSLTFRPWLDKLYEGWDFGGDDPISKRYTAWYTGMDGMKRDHTMLGIFLAMNDDHAMDRGYGAYLNGHFKLDGHRGADINAIHWYDRNLRIYRNIQDITTGPEDRILVLFGAGHMGILKNLFDCDPAYHRVRLAELLR